MKYTLLLSSVALMASAMQAIPNPIETIRIKQGESYILELPGVHVPVIRVHPTPTYKWKLTDLGNQNTVKVEKIIPIKNCWDPRTWKEQAKLDASWKITGLSNGSTTIVFDYECSWDSRSVATKIFEFMVE